MVDWTIDHVDILPSIVYLLNALTKYILANFQITSDSSPLLNLTEMVGCNKPLLDDIRELDAVDT